MTALERRCPRGMSLVELLVALAITGILLGGVFGVVQGQQTAYYEGHLQRAAQGSARVALTFLEQRLQLAGYGMDAPLVFDFDRYPALPCPLDGGCPRDSVNGPDELVFHSRNPRYWVPQDYAAEPRGNAWRVTGIGANAIDVNAREGDAFVRGRVLQAVCRGAARYAYMTVSENVTAAADGPLTIRLLPALAADPFRRQDSALPAVDPCFASGEARMFLIDRFRFHVRPVPRPNGEQQPYLVLDTGLDANGDGPDDAEEIVIAEGIESLQVSYVMTNPALARRGEDLGEPIAFARGALGVAAGAGLTTLDFPGLVDPALSPYRATSWYGYALGPPPGDQRLTDHQANIRAVRIELEGRGPDPDPGLSPVDVFIPILNQAVRPDWADTDVPYHRVRLGTTVLVRNMTARGMTDF